MVLSIDEQRYLLQRRQEIQQEIRGLGRRPRGPRYYDVNDRRVELLDELDRIESELQNSRLA